MARKKVAIDQRHGLANRYAKMYARLTLFVGVLSAPASRRSFTMSAWPFMEARMSTVLRSYAAEEYDMVQKDEKSIHY
jgi:hypothetical protein